jgi:hypothetical protein
MASLLMERTPIPGGVHIHCTGKFKTGGPIDYTVDVLYDGKDYPSHGIEQMDLAFGGALRLKT